MVVREYIQSGTHSILKELKAPLKYSNYKQLRQYKQALQNKDINIETINAESAYIVRENGLLFMKDEPEEDADLENIGVDDGLKFPN